MTPLTFVFSVTCVFLGSLAHNTDWKSSSYVRQDKDFHPAAVGENVTLRCFYGGDAVMIYWYKQILGREPRLMSTFYKHDEYGNFRNEFKDNSRFKLDTGNGKNHLTISHLHISDSATYYCVGVYAYDYDFAEGVTVSVKGSGVNINASVHQSNAIQPGGSVTLNCRVHTGTCDGGHSVYWFKTQEESHPGLIYTHGGRNDQCERKPDTQTHTCVYNLPMKSLNPSHADTDYCAVASCGHILFGDGAQLDFQDEEDSLVLVYFLSGALTFTTILAGLLTYAACKLHIRNSCQCTDCQARSAITSSSNAEGLRDSDNLHYAALRAHKLNKSTRQRDSTETECVYSSVIQ